MGEPPKPEPEIKKRGVVKPEPAPATVGDALLKKNDRGSSATYEISLHRDGKGEWGLELTCETDSALIVTGVNGSMRGKTFTGSPGSMQVKVADVIIGVAGGGGWRR